MNYYDTQKIKHSQFYVQWGKKIQNVVDILPFLNRQPLLELRL